MKSASFVDRLRGVQQVRGEIALLIAPRLAAMPLPVQKYDDPFLPFAKLVIDATRDLVCAYVFDLAAYLAIGAAGAVALERGIAYARADGSTLAILHAPFVGSGYVAAAGDAAFDTDAVTLWRETDAAVYEQAGIGVLLLDSPDLTRGAVLQAADQRIRVLGESVLYAEQGEDFADRLRAAVAAEGTRS